MNTLNRFAVLASVLLSVFTGVNAQDALFVDPAGKVGLGTTSPQYRLHITSTDPNNSMLGLVQTNASLSVLCNDVNNISIALGAEYVNGLWKSKSSSVGWVYKIGDRLKLMRSGAVSSTSNIQPADGISLDLVNGNVGIGTSDLDEKLVVKGNIKAEGDIRSKGRVYDATGDVMPRGVIVMWSGNVGDIPAGWALCNGQNSTPDLVDRFVLGAGSSRGITVNPKTDGGRKTVALGAAELPQHTHQLRDVSRQGTNSEGSGHNHINAHNDNFKTTTEAINVRNGSAFSIMPPYYALCYIMRL
jgi:hypothetical protein